MGLARSGSASRSSSTALRSREATLSTHGEHTEPLIDSLPRIDRGSSGMFPGKEMFHPQIPLRIPCYDLVPISSITVVPPLTGNGASSAPAFHDLTGGEYKTQVRIHRDVADSRLLAIPTSRSQLQTTIRTETGFVGLAPPRGFAALCTGHCSMGVAPSIRAMLI